MSTVDSNVGRRSSFAYARLAMARPTIIRNPANDREFEDEIEQVLGAGLTDPVAAQDRLRARYPNAVVRPRDLEDETAPVWYVYREGRWIAGD